MIKNLEMVIWGRKFNLDVIYQMYSREEISADQIKSAEQIQEIDFDAGLPKLIEYISTHYEYELGSDVIDNIFRYVIPKSIYVTKSKTQEFAIMCNFKFDMEHGLAVVYEKGQLKEIGPKDIIL